MIHPEQYDELRAENARLVAERDHALAEKAAIIDKARAMAAKRSAEWIEHITNLELRIDALVASRDDYRANRDQLDELATSLTYERDALVAERDRLRERIKVADEIVTAFGDYSRSTYAEMPDDVQDDLWDRMMTMISRYEDARHIHDGATFEPPAADTDVLPQKDDA